MGEVDLLPCRAGYGKAVKPVTLQAISFGFEKKVCAVSFSLRGFVHVTSLLARYLYITSFLKGHINMCLLRYWLRAQKHWSCLQATDDSRHMESDSLS